MTQQQWGPPGSQWNPAGQPNQWNPGGSWNRPGFGPPPGSQFRPQQPGFAPFPPPRAPQRGGGLKRLMLALIALAAVAIVGLVVVSVNAPTEVAYQNDDYQVPPPDANPPAIPQPDSYDEAEQLLTSNPLYDQKMPVPVRCEAAPIDVSVASDEQLQTHFTELMECLTRSWQPPITDAGFQIVRPKVNIYGAKAQTKCGEADVNAFYCGADQQVYYSNQLADFLAPVKTSKWGADVVMAHEFGHAVQARTAILISSKALGQQAGGKSAELELNRRLETQADCFSGLFLRSVSLSLGIQQSDLASIQGIYFAIGDDTLSGKPNVEGDHGHSASRQFWGETGLGTDDISKCNTYSADSSTVR